MIITCPECDSRYKIDPSGINKKMARIKCPACAHRFDVDLSLQAKSDTASLAPAPESGSGQPGLLVVDDARFFREMIKDILSDLPIRLLTAADAEEAWRMLQEHRPRLLLLDLNIPGRSGYDLLRDIQQTAGFSEMKILVMSGVQRGDEVSAKVSRLGADGFLNKSFTPKELQDRVRRILAL